MIQANSSSVKNIYQSKIIIIFAFILITEIASFLAYTLQKCNAPKINWIFFIGALIIDLVLLISLRNATKPYLKISSYGINYKNQDILWSEIELVTLRYAKLGDVRFSKSDRSFPYLEIQTKQEIYKIRLKLITDKERRKLLDAINNYYTVMYKNTKYEANYMARLIVILGIIFFVSHIILIYSQF